MRPMLSNPVNWNHPLNQGLIAWWLSIPGAQGEDSLLDLCGKFSCTSSNWSQCEPFGRFNATVFDGSNDKMDIGGPTAELQITGNKSAFAWVKTTSSSTYDEVLVIAGTVSPYHGIILSIAGATAGRTAVWHGGTEFSFAGTSNNDGQWRHIGATIDAGVTNGSAVWLDGQKLGSFTTSATAFTSPTAYTIGSYSTLRYTPCSVGDIRYYDRFLSDDEPLRLFEESHPLNPRQYQNAMNWPRQQVRRVAGEQAAATNRRRRFLIGAAT